MDTDKDGRITAMEWSNGLTSVLGLSVPWWKIRNYLVKVDENEMIDYSKFLGKFKIRMDGLSGQI